MKYQKWIVTAGLILIGSAAILIGISDLLDLVQMLDSPLDETAYAGDGAIPPSPEPVLPAGDDQAAFLPVVTSLEDGEVRRAPALTSLRPEKSRPSRLAAPPEPVPVKIPERLIIEAIGVESDIVPVSEREIEYQGELYRQWEAPRSDQLGWHNTSALVGGPGNTVINGHSSGHGETFRYLADLENGDLVEVLAGEYRYIYTVANVIILKERWESIETRMQNASWIGPSDDERLTLISCWPYGSNTHRIVVVAVPLDVERLDPADALDSCQDCPEAEGGRFGALYWTKRGWDPRGQGR